MQRETCDYDKAKGSRVCFEFSERLQCWNLKAVTVTVTSKGSRAGAKMGRIDISDVISSGFLVVTD